MERSEIEKKVCAIVKGKSQFNKEDINMESDLRDNYGIDSIVLVEMLVEMEEVFGMNFDSSMLSYEHFSTANSIVDYISLSTSANA